MFFANSATTSRTDPKNSFGIIPCVSQALPKPWRNCCLWGGLLKAELHGGGGFTGSGQWPPASHSREPWSECDPSVCGAATCLKYWHVNKDASDTVPALKECGQVNCIGNGGWALAGQLRGLECHPIHQCCTFHFGLGHIQGSTNKSISKWNNKAVFLKSMSLFLSLSLSHTHTHTLPLSKNQSIKVNK